MRYLWPYLVGGDHDGDEITVGQVGGRGWLEVPNRSGAGVELYWPLRIGMSRDGGSHLMVYRQGGNDDEIAEWVLGEVLEASGCALLPDPQPTSEAVEVASGSHPAPALDDC